jgi:hemerythrin
MLAMLVGEHNDISKAIEGLTRPRDMDSLLKLFITHAVDEERVMQEVFYPNYIQHRHAHDAIINALKDLSLACDIIELRFHVNQVIATHIMEHDMVLLNGLEMEHDRGNQTWNENKAQKAG